MPTTPRKRKSNLQPLIREYYEDLADLAHQNVMYEMGMRPAFHALLSAAGKQHGWTLIAEQEKKINGKTIRPDGTFKDQMNLVRGYWEAKDTSDKLDTEIEKKRKAGYPLNNIIFEDTASAVLYQNDQRILTADMKDPAKLAELVTEFFRHIEPEIEEFEHAVDEFKERVPDLAVGLAKKIADAHKANPAFKQAFSDFFELCRTSLNPNISQAAVDEMLIQHILTERLIREIFDNPEFVRRNVIAAEVEKVMQAMTSQSFDRNTYLKPLDYFYVSIEKAARTMTDWSDKQYFLNTVYERFFQGYSVKLADTMGIVYTPQEIVDFMCASVAEVLEKEFGKKLWSDDVYIIDPCTGTGNFIVNLIRRIPKAKLEKVYKHRLFANEIMLLPYYIAALNIEHAYFEQAGGYESFEGLCFVDTLDLVPGQQSFSSLAERNAVRVAKQASSPINIVVGNPPYNANQADESDNNKNRAYDLIDRRIKETYVRANSARKTKLYDPYVRFFRWASDRLGLRDGIVCFVTNNSFVHQVACDGLQKTLLREFTSVYHFDLRGNVRQNPTMSGTAYNVFGIQVGVGITIAVRRAAAKDRVVNYAALPLELRREQKLEQLALAKSITHVEWLQLRPDESGSWFQTSNSGAFALLMPIGEESSKNRLEGGNAIFGLYSLGLVTNRDDQAYSFDKDQLSKTAKVFVERYLAALDRFRRLPPNSDISSVVDNDDTSIKWTRQVKVALKQFRETEFDKAHIRNCLYRPFTKKLLYFDDFWNEEQYRQRRISPTDAAEGGDNKAIALTTYGSEKPFMAMMIAGLCDLHLVGAGAGTQVFPFYVYDEDGSNRRENITDWALDHFHTHYKDKKIDKWAIFHYVYGLLHHPAYREKFADNLKRELPRIPFAPDFNAFAEAGKKLATPHLDYEKQKEWELEFDETPGVPLSYRVEDKMRLSKDKTQLKVNPSLTLSGIPPEAFDYLLGNRSALEWVIDQYQVSTDKRSGITSDPNREDDPRYIVRLIGEVIHVSVETMQIISGLPTNFGQS